MFLTCLLVSTMTNVRALTRLRLRNWIHKLNRTEWISCFGYHLLKFIEYCFIIRKRLITEANIFIDRQTECVRVHCAYFEWRLLIHQNDNDEDENERIRFPKNSINSLYDRFNTHSPRWIMKRWLIMMEMMLNNEKNDLNWKCLIMDIKSVTTVDLLYCIITEQQGYCI